MDFQYFCFLSIFTHYAGCFKKSTIFTLNFNVFVWNFNDFAFIYTQNVCIFSCSLSGEDHHFLNIFNWSIRSGDIQILVMAYKVVLQKSDIFTQNCKVFVCNFDDFAFIFKKSAFSYAGHREKTTTF